MKRALHSLQAFGKKVLMERGYRKYTLVLVSFGVLGCGLLLTHFLPSTAAQYTTFAGSIVALYTIYCGGNILTKHPMLKEEEEITVNEVGQDDVNHG